jgi:CheY-like chemotaxis protein
MVVSRSFYATAPSISLIFLILDSIPTEYEFGKTLAVVGGMANDVNTARVTFDLHTNPKMGHTVRPRIIIADDQHAFLSTITQLLRDKFDVVAAVENGQRAIENVASLDPDILVLDVSMPVLNGIETAARLKESGSRARVIFLSAHEDDDLVRAAFSVGAFAYVLKRRLTSDLVLSIRSVLKGHIFVSRFGFSFE